MVALLVSMFTLSLFLINRYTAGGWWPYAAVQDKEQEYFSSKEDFIQTLGPIAHANHQRYGVPASISLAQAILESDWGQSDLAVENKNLYGIKGSSWDPLYLTQEFLDGEFVSVEAPFRSYHSFEASMADHSRLLVEGTDYDPQLYHGVIQADNYVEAAQALQTAGYATDPDYAQKLIHLIQQYQLDVYDS